MPTVFIALGTNLGDRQANLRTAVASLAPAVTVIRASTIYETPPWGYTDQPPFLNMVIEAETGLRPRALLGFLKKREAELGRVESFRYGPRHIDLDILFYADLVLNEDALQIPHPRLHERAFVLVPLVELAPELCHPVLKVKVRTLLEKLDDTGIRPFSV